MGKGISYELAIIAQDIKCRVCYISDALKTHHMGHGTIIDAGKNHSTIQPLKRERTERVPNGRIHLPSESAKLVMEEFNRRLETKNMPPEFAPRPTKPVDHVVVLPATPPPGAEQPGGGAFMAIAARMDLAARRVEEREATARQAGKDLLAAQQLQEEASESVKEAKAELERLGTEFSQRFSGLIRK